MIDRSLGTGDVLTVQQFMVAFNLYIFMVYTKAIVL